MTDGKGEIPEAITMLKETLGAGSNDVKDLGSWGFTRRNGILVLWIETPASHTEEDEGVITSLVRFVNCGTGEGNRINDAVKMKKFLALIAPIPGSGELYRNTVLSAVIGYNECRADMEDTADPIAHSAGIDMAKLRIKEIASRISAE